jgi:asparagine synthase (glutamine-hydrolysing)
MCGIAGAVWTANSSGIDAADLQRMTRVIAHRGPDDDGFYVDCTQRVALGFRRLSIIDLAGGHQPLGNEDGSVQIVFNGEIYNYRELRPLLEGRGHRFATQSDTECIVHAWEEYGPECLRHFRGMFAFALWDSNQQTLFLARDRLGQKPLFYRHESDRLLFGSELKAILEAPDTPRVLDPVSLDLFLTYQYVPHPRCILKGYSKLPPGHFALWKNGKLDIKRYWEPPFRSDFDVDRLADPSLRGSPNWTPDEWRRRLRETLTEAVRLRMRSDVPVGTFLSGGIDSTIITGLMQQQSPRPVHTFSIGFPIQQFDERHYAREAAQHLKTEHHEYIVEPSALEMLDKLVWHYDEPFGDSSAIPTMYLSRVTREHVTVALSGDGGDELFAGYDRYLAVQLAGRMDVLPGFIKRALGWNIWQKIPTSTRQRSFGRRAKRFAAALAQSPETRYLRWIGIFDADLRRELLTSEVQREIAGSNSNEFLLECYTACPDRDFITRTTCTDVLSYLPCDILTKVDIASMAYSLEARSPFLDHHVAELAARMPIELKLRGNKGKQILIETFRDLLPESIQYRSKMGFGVPIDHWFRGELQSLLRDSLLSADTRNRGVFERPCVERLIDEHTSGRWDHSYRLWNLLCFEHWCRTHLDGRSNR